MTEQSDIPQEVWDAARLALFGFIPADEFSVLPFKDVVHMGRCARAILAERERCAGVADAERERHWLNYQNGGMNLDLFYTTAAENVAAAIREGLAA